MSLIGYSDKISIGLKIQKMIIVWTDLKS